MRWKDCAADFFPALGGSAGRVTRMDRTLARLGLAMAYVYVLAIVAGPLW